MIRTVINIVLDTGGAFSFSELLAMELLYFYRLVLELQIYRSEKRSQEIKQENLSGLMANDPSFRKV